MSKRFTYKLTREGINYYDDGVKLYPNEITDILNNEYNDVPIRREINNLLNENHILKKELANRKFRHSNYNKEGVTVKDILSVIKEYDLQSNEWLLIDDIVKGSIGKWSYNNGKLIGHAMYFECRYENKDIKLNPIGCMDDFVDIVEEYNIDVNSKIYVNIPLYNKGVLQKLTNWKYYCHRDVFSTKVEW